MAQFTMSSYGVATATVIAQLGLIVSSSWAPHWPGNTGQCVVDPQPGYTFTVSNVDRILSSLVSVT